MTAPLVTANTFLIGAQKAGTSYLAALLDQSPEVCLTKPKEPAFFTKHYDKGFAYYATLFDTPTAKIRLDASTAYSHLRPRRDADVPGAAGHPMPVPERIAEAAPEAKFLYILRDPVERAASAYRHDIRYKEPPKGPVSLADTLAAQPKMVLMGRYADQIERYLEVFARDRFLFLDFRRLRDDTEALLAEVCTFLDIAPPEVDTAAVERGKHSAYRESKTGRILRHTVGRISPGLIRAARTHLPPGFKTRFIDPVMRAPSEIVFTDKDKAAAFFAEDRVRTEALTGIRV